MNAFTQKIIAIATMLIDHMGAVIPEKFGFAPDEVNFFRVIGRIAFPIFVYLIAEGFRHTKNRGKFLLRLGAFAIISEIPFDLAFNDEINFFADTNIFFTLFLGGAAICALERIKHEAQKFFTSIPNALQNVVFVFSCLPALAFMYLAEILPADYGAIGVAFIFCMYLANQKNLRLAIMAFFCAALHYHTFAFIYRHGFANLPSPEFYLSMIPATLIPVLLFAFYNGKRGASFKWFFYTFYPVHLLILVLLAF